MGCFIFLWSNTGGQTSQPIFTQNGLIKVDWIRARTCLCSKNHYFSNPVPRPQNGENLANFGFGKFLD